VAVANVTVELSEKHQEVRIAAGDSLRLCLNESPTTGYLWTLAGPVPALLADLGSEFEPHGKSIGGAGRRCFAYACKGEIETDLKYVLRRPWLPNEVIDEVSVRLICKSRKAG
jgi:predicted secreted protein